MKITGAGAILWKELIHMARDPFTILFAFLPPIIQVVAFGFAIDTDVRNLATAVYNQDARDKSWELIQQFENTGVFRVVHTVFSREDLTRLLVEGRAVAGIEIPTDYTARRERGEPVAVGLYVDGANNTIALQAVSTAVGLGLKSLEETIPRLDATALAEPPLEIRPHVLFNPDLLSAHFFVPGIIGVALQLSLTMLVAFAIVKEREAGTLEQLMVSPATRLAMLVGKVIPYVLLAFVEMGVLILVMRYIFFIEIRGSLPLLYGLSGLFALAVIGIGLLISTVAKNQIQATQMAIATLLPSIFFSGFIYPRDTMPDFFYGFSYVLPLTYFLEILRGIVLRGAEFSHLTRVVFPLTGIGILLMVLSLLKFRKRLD